MYMSIMCLTYAKIVTNIVQYITGNVLATIVSTGRDYIIISQMIGY